LEKYRAVNSLLAGEKDTRAERGVSNVLANHNVLFMVYPAFDNDNDVSIALRFLLV
jgi:hypothetical protein